MLTVQRQDLAPEITKIAPPAKAPQPVRRSGHIYNPNLVGFKVRESVGNINAIARCNFL